MPPAQNPAERLHEIAEELRRYQRQWVGNPNLSRQYFQRAGAALVAAALDLGALSAVRFAPLRELLRRACENPNGEPVSCGARWLQVNPALCPVRVDWQHFDPRFESAFQLVADLIEADAGADGQAPNAPRPKLDDIPPLDTSSPSWVSNKGAEKLEGVNTATLRRYRLDGEQAGDGMAGIDRYGRQWRRRGTRKSHPWYYRPSLKATGPKA